MSRRGDIGVGTILVIIIIILFISWLVNEGYKECRTDSDCKSNQYCTSTFSCKDIPVIEKATPAEPVNLNFAAVVIGISLIVASIIMKWDSIFSSVKKKKKQLTEKEKQAIGDKQASQDYTAETEDNYEDESEKE